MTGDLRNPPITISQPRSIMLLAIIIGPLIVALGLTIQPNHWMVDGLIPAEWVFVPGGALVTGAGLIGIARPGRLTLSPAGIEYRLLLSTRRAPWNEIQSVGLWSYRSHVGVSLRLDTRRSLQLAGGWPIETQALARLISQARAQWMQGPA